MDLEKGERRTQPREAQKGSSRKKKNALVIFYDGKEFWTTQNQFWQWVREKVIIKAGDNPLRGTFIRANEEKNVVKKNTV